MVKYLEIWVKYEDEKGNKYLRPIEVKEVREILDKLERDKIKNPLDK